ncbi:MAG TPA: hypothetical protein PKK33_09270, partial [Candidatus Cloacimonadota bacterium]|nr:hypothetical protein [Candidatus Cloacimonadota bacterium]
MKYKVTSFLFFLIDFVFVYFSFLFIVKLRGGSHVIIQNYLIPLISFGVIWIITSMMGGKYRIHREMSYGEMLIQVLKTDTYALTICLFLIIFLQKFYYSRMLVFGTIILTTVSELVIYSIIYFSLRFKHDDAAYANTSLVATEDKIKVSETSLDDLTKQKIIKLPYAPEFQVSNTEEAVIVKLWQSYLSNQQQLFDFIDESIDLTKFSKNRTYVINSEVFYNIETIDTNSQELFINLHKINDLRRLNRYFIRVNQNLVQGGVYVLKA